MKAKDGRFKIRIHNLETPLSFKFCRRQLVIIVLKKYTSTVFKENVLSKIILSFSFKIDSITLDPDPN